MAKAEYTVLGTDMPRMGGVERVVGKGIYGIDLKLPDALSGGVLRSEYAHAKIVGIDTSEAKAIPGVRAVVTAADAPDKRYGRSYIDRYILAKDKVRYMGDPVAAVAADSQALVKEALKKIKVTYEPLPVVVDPEETMQESAPTLHEDMPLPKNLPEGLQVKNVCGYTGVDIGDAEAGMAEADVVVDEVYETRMIHPAVPGAAHRRGPARGGRPHHRLGQRPGAVPGAHGGGRPDRAAAQQRAGHLHRHRRRLRRQGQRGHLQRRAGAHLRAAGAHRRAASDDRHGQGRGDHLHHHPLGLQDLDQERRQEGRHAGGAPGQGGVRRRRLLGLRQPGRRPMHPDGGRLVPPAQYPHGRLHRLHQQAGVRSGTRTRRPPGHLRHGVAHGLHRRRAGHGSHRVPAEKRCPRRATASSACPSCGTARWPRP